MSQPKKAARAATEPDRDRDAARRQRLSALGLRVTEKRLAVLRLIEAAPIALSHADIETALPKVIDPVTLYRILDSFVEVGLAGVTVGADRVRRFGLLGGDPAGHHEHAHFHCDDCGKVYCLASKPPRRPNVPDGFVVEGVDMHIHGHCPTCLQDKAPAAHR